MSAVEEPVTIGDALVIRETEAAVLVRVEEEDFWIPKSQIDNASEVWSMKNAGPGDLVVPRWLAEKLGFEV